MNRGRLRRYALRVVAAVSLGIGAVVIAGGVAQAATTPSVSYGKILPAHQEVTGTFAPSETVWG
jgi:hypothetical protein